MGPGVCVGGDLTLLSGPSQEWGPGGSGWEERSGVTLTLTRGRAALG